MYSKICFTFCAVQCWELPEASLSARNLCSLQAMVAQACCSHPHCYILRVVQRYEKPICSTLFRSLVLIVSRDLSQESLNSMRLFAVVFPIALHHGVEQAFAQHPCSTPEEFESYNSRRLSFDSKKKLNDRCIKNVQNSHLKSARTASALATLDKKRAPSSL